MALANLLTIAIISFISFIIASLPLHFAVKVLGGRTSLFKTMFTITITGLVITAINYKFQTWGGIIALIFSLWIYKEIFELGWIKAFFAWILQFIFVIVLVFIISAIIGVSLII
jgi:hypothetical protein